MPGTVAQRETILALEKIQKKVYRTTPHTMRTNFKKQHRRSRDVLQVRRLIILCTALAIILSSIAVCDGNWLHTAGGRMFGLWYFCTTEVVVADAEPRWSVSQGLRQPWNMGQNHRDHPRPAMLSYPSCTTQFGGGSGVAGAEVGLGLCRSLVTLAVVAAIFGLELQVMCHVSEGLDAARRWQMGSAFVLLSAAMSALGVAVFVTLLWEFAMPMGFTLTFWSQFTAVCLFCLNGMAGRHIGHMDVPWPARGSLEKC